MSRVASVFNLETFELMIYRRGLTDMSLIYNLIIYRTYRPHRFKRKFGKKLNVLTPRFVDHVT